MKMTFTIEFDDDKVVKFSEEEARELWSKLNEFYNPNNWVSWKTPETPLKVWDDWYLENWNPSKVFSSLLDRATS